MFVKVYLRQQMPFALENNYVMFKLNAFLREY